MAAVYFWVLMIVLGAVVLETFMVYPNIFADPPRSLGRALEFLQVVAPSDFFPPLGFAAWAIGAATVVLSWNARTARGWIAASFVLLLADGLFSMLFHWPRNTILFVEGPRVHSAEVLVRTAAEFQRLHWSRVVFTAGAAATMFEGLLRLHRHRLDRPGA